MIFIFTEEGKKDFFSDGRVLCLLYFNYFAIAAEAGDSLLSSTCISE